MLTGYVEVHHVLPKCMGGTDAPDNLVALTAEEHFVAHQLLCKMHPEVRGLAFAMVNMTGDRYGHRRNKLYGWMRRKASAAASEQMRQPDRAAQSKATLERLRTDPAFMEKNRAAVGKASRERVWTPEQRATVAEQRRHAAPRKFSEEGRANMSAAQKKRWAEGAITGENQVIAQKRVATRRRNGTYVFSQEWRDNIGKAGMGRVPPNKGKKTPPETRAKQSEAAKRRWARAATEKLENVS